MVEAKNEGIRQLFDRRPRLEFRGGMTVFQMAEVAVPEELFADLLERIRTLAASPT